MAWTFSALPQLDLAIAEYNDAFSERLDEADDDDSSQKVLNENDEWIEFNEALREYEDPASDKNPSTLPDVREGRKRYRNYRRFTRGPFTLVYRLNTMEETAVAVLFYHQRDRARRIKEFVSRLASL